MPDKRQLRTAAGALRVLADFLAAVAKYALTGFMVLVTSRGRFVHLANISAV